MGWRTVVLTGTAAILLGAAAPAAGSETGRLVLDTYVEPAVAALEDGAVQLRGAVAALCDQPGDAGLAAARDAFADALDRWAAVSVLRFGPVSAASRFERLFFWPDARGIGLKQIQGLLASPDQAVGQGGVAGKSAALQGFPALEFVLYGTGSQTLGSGDPQRCSVAAAIASNIATISADIARDWAPGSPFARSFAKPADTTEPYRTATEVDAEIVKALSTTLQFVRAAEIGPVLRDPPDPASGKRAPLWRSGLTARLVAGQLDGARRLLAATKWEQTLPEDSIHVAGSIRFELDSAIRVLSQVEGPVETSLREGPDRDRFAFALLALDHANELINDQLSAALGLSMGFNALDGD